MSTPSDTPEIPELDIQDWSPGRLMAALLTDEIALPVWLRIERTRHKVTAESVRDVCRGILISMELNQTMK